MIEIQSRDLERVRPLLNSIPKEVKKAITRSVNLGASKSRTYAVRQTTNDYYIKARDIKEAINISRATYQTPQASMIVRGRQLSRIRFKVVGRPGPSKSIHPRLQIGTKKSEGMKTMENRFYQMGSNVIMHVFYRKNPDKRNPIGVDRGYSVPQMLGTSRSIKLLEEQAVPIVENEFERQIHHLLRGGR